MVVKVDGMQKTRVALRWKRIRRANEDTLLAALAQSRCSAGSAELAAVQCVALAE